MKGLLNSRLKYLLLLPIILMICFVMFFKNAYDDMGKAIFNEKMVETRQTVDAIGFMVDSLVESDRDWETYNYPHDIAAMIEVIDQRHGTFAAIYDCQFNLLTQRYAEEGALVPFQFSEFVSAVKNNNSGDIVLNYDTHAEGDEFNLYYKWLPSSQDYDRRILIVVGLTINSVETRAAQWIPVNMMIIIGVTFLANLIMIIMLIHTAESRGACGRRQSLGQCPYVKGKGDGRAPRERERWDERQRNRRETREDDYDYDEPPAPAPRRKGPGQEGRPRLDEAVDQRQRNKREFEEDYSERRLKNTRETEDDDTVRELFEALGKALDLRRENKTKNDGADIKPRQGSGSENPWPADRRGR